MNSLQIYIYGTKYNGFLDINPETNLQFESIAEAFDEDLTTGEFSLPIDVPWTANNRKLLGFAERVTNLNSITYYWQCDVLHDGWTEFKKAKFTILEKAGKFNYLTGSFSASISGTKAFFGSLIKNKKLTDLTLGGAITYSTESREFAQDVMEGNLPQYNYLVFVPVAIENFFQTDRSDYDNEFLAKDTVNYVIVNGSSWTFGRPQSTAPTTATITGTVEHRDYRTVPFFKLKYVFKELFAQFGYIVKGDFIDDPDFDNLLVFNNFSLEKYTTGHADYNRSMAPKNHVPDMGLDEFLQAVLFMFRLKLSFTGTNEVTLRFKKKDLNKASFANITEFATNNFKGILPGNERKDGYKIGYTWDAADQFITDRVKDLTGKTFCATVETRVELNTLNIGRAHTTDDYAFVVAENMFYLVADYTNPLDIKWDCYSENLDAFTEGNGQDDIQIPLSTLCQYAEFNTTTALWERRSYLGCRQPGSYTSNAGNQVTNKFALRIFFGSIREVETVDVPNSYNHNRVANNNAVFMPYSFTTNGDAGFLNQFHKQWQSFLLNHETIETSLIYNKRMDALLKASNGINIQGVYFLLYKKEPSIPANLTMDVQLVPL